jgi:hypothetical protein
MVGAVAACVNALKTHCVAAITAPFAKSPPVISLIVPPMAALMSPVVTRPCQSAKGDSALPSPALTNPWPNLPLSSASLAQLVVVSSTFELCGKWEDYPWFEIGLKMVGGAISLITVQWRD